jgi:predicted MFS family arabinose efflux permease
MGAPEEPDHGAAPSSGPGRERVRHRTPLVAVLGANAVSQVGDLTVAVALPWFVLQTTGSVVQMGFTGAVVGTGALLASVTGGPLVDRLGLRRASVVSDLAAGAAVAAIPLLSWAGVLPFGLFLALAFVVSVLNAPGDMARRALVPTLARLAAMPLERANSADAAIARLAQLAGPVLGGVLVAVAGAEKVLLIDAATFVVSAVAVAAGVPSHADGTDAPAGVLERDRQVFADCRPTRSPARQYLSELREGFRFVRSSGLLVSLVVVAAVANLLEKPLMSVVAPLYAEDLYGSAASFGAMLGAFGAGALAGALAFGVVGHRLPRRLTFVVCLTLAPLVMFGSLAATPPLPVLLVVLAVSGVIFGPMNALSATAVQETTPPRLLGRVFGTVSALSMVGVPLGAAGVGVIVAQLGLVPTLVVMGGCYLVLAIVMAGNPALRAMDSRGVET